MTTPDDFSTPPATAEGVALETVGPAVYPLDQRSVKTLAADVVGRWDWLHTNTPGWHHSNVRFTGIPLVDADGSWEISGRAFWENSGSHFYRLRFAARSNALLWLSLGLEHSFTNVTNANPTVRVINALPGKVSVVVRSSFDFHDTYYRLEAGSYLEVTIR